MATVTIQKRKRDDFISYLVNYKDPRTGKKKYYKSHRKLKDAQSCANKLRDLIDSGKLFELEKNKKKIQMLSFSEVADLKITEWHNRLERGDLSPVTFEGYKTRIDILKREFKKRLLCEISKTDLLQYQTNLFKESSAVSSNRNFFVIKQIFKKGLELNAVSEDHASGIRYLSEKKHERNSFLMPHEIEKLIEASQKTKAKFYMPALIYLGAEHGTSRQEVLSLEWDDIRFDFEETGLIRFFRTKNGKERTDFLMPRSRAALLTWRDHLNWMRKRKRISRIEANYVFCKLDGTSKKRFDSAWRKICKLAGIENFHYHDLRHTFCSSLILSGSNLKDVKEMIGHGDIKMTDRYTHLNVMHKKRLQDQLANYYEYASKN